MKQLELTHGFSERNTVSANKKAQTKKQRKPWSKKKKALIFSFLSLGILASIGATIAVNTDWQMLKDERIAKDYTPTAEIEEMTKTLRLTRKGKSIFYASHPKLMTSNAFNLKCGRDGDNTYTSGCYYKDDDGVEHIHIYDSGTTRLDENGVHYNFVADRNITAIHELLHAAYERLDEDTRVEVCKNVNSITSELKGLSDSVQKYPEDKRCTEGFARIGSAYIIALTGRKGDAVPSYTRDDLSDSAKEAADKLSEQYQIYYSYNNELFDEYCQNQTESLLLKVTIMVGAQDLVDRRDTITRMINNYAYAPSAWKYNYIMGAIDDYKSDLATLKSYYSTYCKIYETLDSEHDSILASLFD